MSHSKTGNVLRSTLAGVGNNLALVLLGLLSRSLFLDYIGLDYLSVAQVISNLLTVLAFTDLGIGGAVIYMLYAPVAHHDVLRVQGILYLFRRYNRYIGVAIFVLGLMLLPFLPFFIQTGVPQSEVTIIYLLNLVTSASSYFFTYRSVLFSAHQQDYLVSVLGTVVSFVRIFLQCALIYITHSYFVFLITGLIAGTAQNAFLYIFAGRRYAELFPLKGDGATAELTRELRHNLFSMISVRFAGLVINNTDTLLISWIDTLIVGLCANYLMISNQLKTLISIFHNALSHSIGIAAAEKSPEELYFLFQKVWLCNTFLTSIVSVCLGVLWEDFIVLWIGDGYVVGADLMFAMWINFYFVLITAPLWIFRDARGLFVRVQKMLYANAFLNLVLSIALMQVLGISGIYLGTIAADLLTNFWYDSCIVYHGIFLRTDAIRYQANILEASLTVIVLVILIKHLFISYSPTVSLWLFKLIISIFIYCGYFYLRYHRREAFHDGIAFATKMVRRLI